MAATCYKMSTSAVLSRTILKSQNCMIGNRAVSFKSFRQYSNGKKILLGVAATFGVGAATVGLAVNSAVLAGGLDLHPSKQNWSHNGILSTLDHASMRRGYFVYKQVCAACHSMKYMYYRQLVGVIMTEEEAKEEAKQITVVDGPNDEGKMFERQGKLSDPFPKPYPNDEAAKAANNGALPPDLSFVVNARHGMEDYVFALLTGYVDPPPGMEQREGMAYNPYFPGGWTSMAQQLFDEMLEYEDGTPASISQLAKDVTTFLRWTSEFEHDDRKRMGLKVMMAFALIIPTVYYMKRLKWSTLKTRKLAFMPKQYKS